MLAVEMGRWAEGDKELRTVGVASSVGHAQDARAVMLEGQCARLVGELVARTTCARARWVAALRHKALNHPVEGCSVVITLPTEKNEIINGHRRLLGKELDGKIAAISVEDGL